jgi:hypothetical protein
MSDKPLSALVPIRSAAPSSATSAAGLGFALFSSADTNRPIPLRMRASSRQQAEQPVVSPSSPRHRTKIWEFGTNLHCSIIGTCLSTGELRQVLGKIGLREEAATAGEHDVHATGVLLAGKHHDGAKLLQKALDRRHRAAINRFDKARSAEEVRGLWREFVQAGDIPGAYWAALTHPAATDAVVREIFTEVHMLSHLVGAANRADIRRLRQLEAENAELQAKVDRQQQQLRVAIVSRDTTIRELNRALEARIERGGGMAAEASATAAARDAGWEALAADLKARLTRSENRRVGLDQQLAEARAALSSERSARNAAEQREAALRDELDAIEERLAADGNAARDAVEESGGGSVLPPVGLTLLYVGGRPGQVAYIRAAAERLGAALIHHDGGIEERGGLLPGLVSRADAVLFPVDCISHAAMQLIKRLCRQADKPFLPLRSGGLAPFCAALRSAALGCSREEA